MALNTCRFLADFIDFIVSCFVSSMIGFILSWGREETPIWIAIVYFVLFFLTFTFKDHMFHHASLGKKIMEIKIVYDPTHEKHTIRFLDDLKRVLPLFIWPVEALLIITNNQRIGDMWAKTKVIRE